MNVNRLSLEEQLERKALICPKTKRPVQLSDGFLINEDGARYPIIQGAPILLENPVEAEKYIQSSQAMIAEYQAVQSKKITFRSRVKSFLSSLGISYDYRTEASRNASCEVLNAIPAGGLALSIGGGPKRNHPALVNVNIGLFPNVDCVADAHHLPYADNSVDVIFCDAVLEHLRTPEQAVKEMYRVLKKEGRIYVSVPFLQAFHGYPHHYQNFTLMGHRGLYDKAGFKILNSGTDLGPVNALIILNWVFITHYFPRFLRGPMGLIWLFSTALLRPLDRVIGRREDSFVMASTTFVVASK